MIPDCPNSDSASSSYLDIDYRLKADSLDEKGKKMRVRLSGPSQVSVVAFTKPGSSLPYKNLARSQAVMMPNRRSFGLPCAVTKSMPRRS